MILVDTSVMIDYFKGVENEPTNKLGEIINLKRDFGICNFIYQEIIQGAATEAEFETLKTYLSKIKFWNLKNDRNSYTDSAKIYFLCRKKGITVRSTIDLLIVQIAIENGLALLHNDKDFDNIKKVIPELTIY